MEYDALARRGKVELLREALAIEYVYPELRQRDAEADDCCVACTYDNMRIWMDIPAETFKEWRDIKFLLGESTERA